MSAASPRGFASARSVSRVVRSALLLALTSGGDVRAQAPVHLRVPSGGFFVELTMRGDDVLMSSVPFAGASWRVDLFDAMTGNILLNFPNPDPSVHAFFGVSLATLGGNVVVGALDAQSNFSAPAAVHLFDGTNGMMIRAFENPNPLVPIRNEFGRAVAGVGNAVAVGARLDDTATDYAGAVYLFDASTAALLHTFLPPNAMGNEYFGSAVAAVGSNVAIGAPGAAGFTGEVHLFDTSGTLLRTFSNPDPQPPNDTFGSVVAAYGSNVLAVGYPGVAVYLFDATTGNVLLTLPNPSPTTARGFGGAVTAAGANILVGGHTGAAYDFTQVYLYGPTGTLLRTITNNFRHETASSFGAHVATAGGAIVASGGFTGAFVYCGGAAGCERCETCGSGGTCVAAPNPTCHQASLRSRLKIKNSNQDGGDRVRWRWQADGFAFSFGDPLDSTDYNVCFWEPSDNLVFAATAPSGGDCNGSPCWRQSGDRTATYTDGAGTPDGLVNLRLNDTNHRGTASVNGKGPLLSSRPFGLPSTPAPFGLPLRVQIEAEDLWCGEAELPTAKRNTGDIFQARTE